MDLEALKAECKKVLEAMNSLFEKMNDPKAEDGAKATLKTEYEGKQKEFNALKAKIEAAKAHGKAYQEGLALVQEVAGLSAPANTGTINPVVPAEAKDHEKIEAEKENLFSDWFCGKTISERGREALTPKSNWKGENGANTGLAMPKKFVSALMPETQQVGKALPLTSTQASPANLFQADFQKNMLQYPAEPAAIYPNVFKIPTRSGSILWPKLQQAAPAAEGQADEFAESGYAAVGWTAEGAVKPGTEPKFTQESLLTHELSAKTELSRTLLNRSSINLESLLPQLFRGSIMHKLDHALINGDGNGKPTGILQTAGIGAPARGGPNAVAYDDFVNLEHAVAPQLRPGSAWVIADGAMKYVKKLKDGQNRPLFIPITKGAGEMGNLGFILGYPVIPTQRTTLGAAGDVIFGNWYYYVSPVEQEVVMLRSEHQKIDQGVIVFVVFMQVGGKCVQVRAFAKLPA